MCDCMATVHALVANCLQCGKVNCRKDCNILPLTASDQESGGATASSCCCSFCKQPLFTAGSVRRRKQTSRVASIIPGNTYRSKLTGKQQHGSVVTPVKNSTGASTNATVTSRIDEANGDPAAQAAQSFRDRLLAADKSAAERQRIHDVTEDYEQVSGDIWLTPEERALAMRAEQEFMRRREEEHQANRITIDLESREIISAPKAVIDKEDWRQKLLSQRQEHRGSAVSGADDVGAELRMPIYRPQSDKNAAITVTTKNPSSRANRIRILQDEAYER